jgi:predicted hotdog family 3-hydroxylacyl-ACP dehydratase
MGRTLYDIEQVVPHRGAMRLVDRLLDWDDDRVAVEATVPADGPFHDGAGVPAWIGIEYMAQAIAAWAGCQARVRGEETKLGFLLGSRRYSAETGRFAAGSVLRIEARRELFGDNGLGMFACRILQGERVVASANVSVYQPADPRAYLEQTGSRQGEA